MRPFNLFLQRIHLFRSDFAPLDVATLLVQGGKIGPK